MPDWRHLLLGPPLPSYRMLEERLGRARALAALAPDALASIAYANQEIYLGLAVAGAAGLGYSWTIALTITALLLIVSASYMQTISAYPSGGGSYTVARENLGERPGMVAAAALMTDYVLNVAVSVTAGVAAIASAYPQLWQHRTELALVLLAFITLANLRGLRESSGMLALPVYLFVGSYLAMIGVGLLRAAREGPGSLQAVAPPPIAPVSTLLLLRTFSAGCTALTGVESISNGVPVFSPPESKHANQTMAAMSGLMAILFLGTVGLTQFLGVVPGPDETILSALARRVLGPGPLYVVLQAVTLAILVVAANTSFVGFPRVASVVARDGYLPRPLTNLGDRLVYSRGILLLSILAGILVLASGADTHALIPLFAIGAFLAFSLSQAGMVVHWVRRPGPHWRTKAALNGLGALVTSTTLLVIGANKFLYGAWMVILLIPALVAVFGRIHRHYQMTASQLALSETAAFPLVHSPIRVVVPISGVHRGTIGALAYAASISPDVTAVYVEMEPGSGDQIQEAWQEAGLDAHARLVIVPSPYRSLVGPLLDYLHQEDAKHSDTDPATVVVPELIPAKWWEGFLHNQSAWLIKLALLYGRRRFGHTRPIVDWPLYLRE